MVLAQGKKASPGVCKLREEQEWLERKLGELRATIYDAEQKQTEGRVFALSLQEMKDFVGDAEDLIDEFEYEELRRRIERERGSGASASSLLEKVNEIKRRFLGIEKSKNGLGIGDVDTRERMRQTSSFSIEPEIFGREEEKEEIIRFLLAPEDHDSVVSTIAIAGMGGLGKTTLAQLVYNDGRVAEHFNPRMWVCTAPDYDVMTLTREILGSIDMDIEFPWGLENLDVYHSKIVEKLEGKQFLLVLDDMWDRDQRKWQCLLAPLRFAKKGSKILITTRDSGLANILQSRKTIQLGGLPFHHCWMLFKNHAFFAGDSAAHPRLKAIGKQIVGKFKGVPLAAAVIGDLLHSTLEESEWRRILESEMWEIEKEEEGILSVLKLSYEHLPPRLKQCIAYCSLFPKNHRFEKFDLVQRWMAQGILQTETGGRVEDVGMRCFNDLFNRSFFQLVDGEIVVHDLIHDLALLVSHGDHLSTHIDGLHRILRDNHSIRHLSLLMTSTQPDLDDLERLLACRRLRTLALHFPSDSECQIPGSLFLSLNTLRVCGHQKIIRG